MFSFSPNLKSNVIVILLLTSMTIVTVKTSFADQNTITLSIEEAAKIALERDFLVKSYLATSNAFQQSSIAINTLPDPKLRLGLLNYPVDTFSRGQEPMTQNKIGITQMFPKGNSLEIKSQREIIRSAGNLLKANDRRRKVLESARKAWLEVYYWNNAKKILDQNRRLFKDLVDISESQYASGTRRQIDYVQAQLQLDLLNDKDFLFESKEELARVELSKWVGNGKSQASLTRKLPEFHEDIKILKYNSDINKKLLSHPMILMSQNKIEVNKKSVELAQQDYKPGWSLDFSYGFREGKNQNNVDRPDFVSAMVMIDIPLFTSNRQDRRVLSQLKQVAAAKNNFDDALQVITTKFEKTRKRLLWLKKRINHYNETLFPRTKEQSEAALLAYKSDRTDFHNLIKARITEFTAQLQFLRLNVDHVKTEATLSYLLGDEK